MMNSTTTIDSFLFDDHFMPSSSNFQKLNNVVYYQDDSNQINMGYFSQPCHTTVSYYDGLSSPEVSSPVTPRFSPMVTEQVDMLPEFLLPEFRQYSKEAYENGVYPHKKRKNSLKKEIADEKVKRQIHIQSEQKRRAQINDGFEELRQRLPGCIHKKMSKAALLHSTVQHLQHLERNQNALLAELELIMRENEQLKKSQPFFTLK